MIIINLQFFKGDKEHAMALARLVADLEVQPRADVTFLFTARFDTTHDRETVEYVRQKFPVLTYTTKRRAVGWPAGPNQMMADSYGFCIENTRNKRIKAHAILFMESDDVPLHRNWINMLMEEFDASGKQVMGAWLSVGDLGASGDHINGNCIISTEFWRKHKRILNPPSDGGWDALLANDILPNGHPSRLMWSDYYLGTDRNPWRGDDYLFEPKRYIQPRNPLYGLELHPVFLHGPKNGLGINPVRNKLLNEQPSNPELSVA